MPEISATNMPQLLLQGGSFAVLAWIVWFVFSKGLPKILETFVHTLRGQQETFNTTLTEQRERFFASLEKMQDININSYREHRDSLNAQNQLVVTEIKDLKGAVQDLKSAVHELILQLRSTRQS